jgi:hypothetical protein
MLLFVHLSTTDLEFSRFNTEWNGTSRFFWAFSAAGGTDVTDLAELGGEEDALLQGSSMLRGSSMLIMIAPAGNLSPDRAEYLRLFVVRGNTLFLADETGDSNTILAAIGSSMRIDGRPLASIDMEWKTPASVVAYAVRADPLLGNVSSVVLNAPSAVYGGEPLLASSPLSWIDANRDIRVNANESMSSATVLARERLGAGTVYVLTDPSIFTNSMVRASPRDNAAFIADLLGRAPHLRADATVSRTAGADGILLALNAAKNTTIIKIGLLFLLLAAIAVVAGRSDRRA